MKKKSSIKQNTLDELPPIKKVPVLPQPKPLPEKVSLHLKKKKSFWKPIFVMLGIFFLLSGIAVGIGIGLLNHYLDQMPTIPYLENYSPWMPSRMFSGSEEPELIADFFNHRQNREMVPLYEMPQNLINAVVGLEDIRFYKHFGISPRAFVRAAYHDLRTGTREQGGSTITMQLAEDLILNKLLPYKLPQTGAKAFTQKIFEILLALQIEKRYTKDEILEIYLNQVFLGGNIYGVANAAEFYFGKHISELTLKECALFAGMLQRPNAYSPIRYPERAQNRTDLVLHVMKREGFITQEEYEQAINEPFELQSRSIRRPQIAKYPYFSWAVHRQFANHKLKSKDGLPIEIYGQGIDVYTTIDTDLQRIAENALRNGIEESERYRRQHGGRNWGHPTYGWVNKSSPSNLVAGHEYDGKTVSDYDPETKTIQVTLINVNGGKGPFTVPIDLNKTWLDEFDILKEGYFIRVKSVTNEEGKVELRLAKNNYVQGALVAVQPSTGKVLALVGGYDYNDNSHGGQYIRALQSVMLQPGSAFKPLLYTTVLSSPEKQWTVASMLKDEEIEYWEGWAPENFENMYFGEVTMRYALIHSLNAATVWLLDNYMNSRSAGIQYLRLFCRNAFDLHIDESNLSIALGTSGTTPFELAQAYAVLANNGNFVDLHMVDRVYQRMDAKRNYPNLLYEFKQPTTAVQRITPEVAYLTTHMLRGVIEEGTGDPAKELPFYTVGKTGTTDHCVYAWFAGYSKDLLCVVYLGYDSFGYSLGLKRTGSKVALPVWMDFMGNAYNERPELFGEIEPPDSIVFKTIDTETGLLASSEDENAKRMPFIKGTEPTTSSSLMEDNSLFPYKAEANKLLLSEALVSEWN